MEVFVSGEFKGIKVSVGWKKGEVSPNDVNDQAGVMSRRGGVGKWREGEEQGVDSKLHYQEREAVMWIEKLKTVGGTALGDNRWGDCKVDKRVVVTEMSNINVGKGMAKSPSETPVKVISSNIRTLRDRDSDGGSRVGVVRHTLGRRESCQW